MPQRLEKHFVTALYVILGLLLAINVLTLLSGNLLALLTLAIQLVVLGAVYFHKSWAYIVVRVWEVIAMLAGLPPLIPGSHSLASRLPCLCSCFCAQERAALRGPYAAVRRGRSGRAAGVAMEGNAFSRGQESARKARPRLTDSEGRMPGERRIGVAFSLGYFSLGHAREK